ncbi:MAG: hypothetical protein KAH35_05135 [Candidatus Atribacteria bacterium]|nr:hypothetical protein [Candidatus Atribacteria bacterium]
MQYLKRNTKYSIFAFLVTVLATTISTFTLAKTQINFSLCDNPQILLNTSLKPEVQTININTASQDDFINILQISQSLTQKIIDPSLTSFPFPPMSFPHPFMSFPRSRESINSSNELGGFKDLQDLLQLLEITNLDLREWEEEGIKIDIH